MSLKVLEGLNRLAKYPGFYLCAEHDQIWALSYDTEISEEDKVFLEETNWFEDAEGWSHFV